MKNLSITEHNWTPEEILLLEKYVATNSDQLIADLYKNILVGYIRFGKPNEFFNGLSKMVDRTKAQCKSKFNSMESQLYIKLLRVPCLDFCLLVNIRQQKINKKYPSNEPQSQKEIDVFSKKGESGSVDELLYEKKWVDDDDKKKSSATENGFFYKMSDDEIKQRRLKIMQLYLARKLEFSFRNEGWNRKLIQAEEEFITKLVKKTIEESMYNSCKINKKLSLDVKNSESDNHENNSAQNQNQEYFICEKVFAS